MVNLKYTSLILVPLGLLQLFCLPDKRKPIVFRVKMEIQYVLFNNESSKLISKDYSENVPSFWDPSTGIRFHQAADEKRKHRRKTPRESLRRIKNNLGTDLILCKRAERYEIFDVLGDRPLGSYTPEHFPIERPVMISPRKRLLLEWVDQSMWKPSKRGRSGSWTNKNNYLIKVHSLASNSIVKTFDVYQHTFFHTDGTHKAPVTFSADGQWLAIVQNGPGYHYSEAFVDIYHTSDFHKVLRKKASSSTIDIMFSPEKTYLAERCGGGFRISEVLSEPERTFRTPRHTNRLFFFDERYAVCSTTGELYLVDCTTGKSRCIDSTLYPKSVDCVKDKLVYIDKEYVIHVVTIPTMEEIWTIRSPYRKVRGGQLTRSVLSPDGEYAAFWNSDHIALWNLDAKKCIGYLTKMKRK